MTDLRALIDAVEAGVFPGTASPEEYHAFSGSIDVAVKMVERDLPGWKWALYGTGLATLHPEDTTLGKSEFLPGNPARALLLAALRAKLEGE